MKQILKRIFTVLAILQLNSCLDMISDKPQKIVGDFYLWNSGGGKQKYLMNKIDKSFYSYIINETVSILLANDSIVCVKSSFQENTSYYAIKHLKGEKVIELKKIDSVKFSQLKLHERFDYSYDVDLSK